MSYILINRGLETAYRKTKLVWHIGIDAVKIVDGKFVLPDRVIPIVDQYNHGMAVALGRFPKVEDPVFIEYDEDDNRTN